MPSYAGPSASRPGEIAGVLRLLAFLVLAGALMVLDYRGGWLHAVRVRAEAAMQPLWWLAGLPSRAGTSLRENAVTRAQLASAEQHFERYGVISLLAGRFIGPLRPMLPMVAGMLDMPFGRFTAVSLLAGSGWAVAYLLPGWATGAALRLPLPAGGW